MTWSFLTPRTATPLRPPVANDAVVLIVPNERGGFSMRIKGDDPINDVGNYATPTDAARIARLSFENVEIVEPQELPTGPAALPTGSLASHLAEAALFRPAGRS
jgi:hypothetical protein